MGSPANETGRRASEGPRRVITVEAFWMARYELTWDVYHQYMLSLDHEAVSASDDEQALARRRRADAVSRPTPPYVPMDFGMGTSGYPAISMTQFAARHFTKWLSMKTGRFYRLPSEAEWEYACRAGTTSAFSFGDGDIDRHARHAENSPDGYGRVGELTPNPWGLHDMHGNVAEWTLDQYTESYDAERTDAAPNWPTALYPRTVRGGSWDDDPEALRCAARRPSEASWKLSDPQLPKSIWYHTDAPFVGLRVVRPLAKPTAEEMRRAWEPDLEEIRQILGVAAHTLARCHHPGCRPVA